MNNEDLDYILKFSKISIIDACNKAGVKKNNLYARKVSKNKIKKVRKILESSVAELYLYKEGEIDENKRTSAL